MVSPFNKTQKRVLGRDAGTSTLMVPGHLLQLCLGVPFRLQFISSLHEIMSAGDLGSSHFKGKKSLTSVVEICLPNLRLFLTTHAVSWNIGYTLAYREGLIQCHAHCGTLSTYMRSVDKRNEVFCRPTDFTRRDLLLVLKVSLLALNFW